MSRRSLSWCVEALLLLGLAVAPLAAKESRAPQVLMQVPPEFPLSLREAGVEGRADVQFIVGADGQVGETEVKFATHPEFGTAALAAVGQWRFRPGIRDGQPAAYRVIVPFSFTIRSTDPFSRWAGRPVWRELEAEPVAAESLPRWPQPEAWIEPPYPRSLKGTGRKGSVVVEFVVDPDGQVVNPRVLQSDDDHFIVPALVAAIALRFPPPRDAAGGPTSVSMAVQFNFDEKRANKMSRILNRRRNAG